MTSWAGSLIYTWRKTELSHCSLTFLDYHIKPPGSLIPNTNRPPMLALSLRNWCLIKVPFKFDKIVQRLTGRNFIFQFWQNHTECNLCKSEPGQYLPCAGITTRGSPYSLLISTDREGTKARGITKMPMTRIWFTFWSSLVRSLRYYYEKGIMQKVAGGGWRKSVTLYPTSMIRLNLEMSKSSNW